MFNIVWDYKNLQWSLVTTRKPAKCDRCRAKIAKGSKAYRPLTNGNHRMERLCVWCGNRVELAREKELETR